MTTFPLSDARRELPSLIDQAQTKAITISRHGIPAAVVLSPSRYEELLTALEDLQDLALIESSLSDTSPSIPWELVKGELGLA
ncbi:MAG: type II toxin-antitoxin system Phd/YefM family antitoxin [Candidatus Planktophila sp.]|nr:type II toxin-antitoxin system Phd/YefM family antitoxin [Candidatus Planktophila sp.]